MHNRTVLPLILAATACGGTSEASDVAVRDSAGIRIVASSGVDRPLPWSFVEERRIGGADAGPASFTAASPALVRTNQRDRIMVLDRDQSQVVMFDADGRHLATMGGAGSGPGEFVLAFELLDAGPGAVAVFDFGKRAAVRWSVDGALLPETSPTEGLGAWNGLVLRGDTTLVGLEESDSLRTLHRLVRLTPGDTVTLDSLLAPPRTMAEFDCFAARMPPMFAPRLAWRVSGGRLAVTRQREYRVDLFDGVRLVRSVRRDIAPTVTTPEMASRMYPDGWTVSFQGGGRCTIDGAEVADQTGMASHLPVVAELGFGPGGSLWVRRHTFPGEPPTSDVFDAEGAYLGTVSGRGVPLGWLGDDRILFPIEDATTGVTVIGIYRIEMPSDEGASGP